MISRLMLVCTTVLIIYYALSADNNAAHVIACKIFGDLSLFNLIEYHLYLSLRIIFMGLDGILNVILNYVLIISL